MLELELDRLELERAPKMTDSPCDNPLGVRAETMLKQLA
jgi:hypothetical protein